MTATVYQLIEKDTDSNTVVTDALYLSVESAIEQGETLIREAVEDPNLEVTWQYHNGVFTWTRDAMQVEVSPRRVDA